MCVNLGMQGEDWWNESQHNRGEHETMASRQNWKKTCKLGGGWTKPFEKSYSNWITSSSRGENKKYLSCHHLVNHGRDYHPDSTGSCKLIEKSPLGFRVVQKCLVFPVWSLAAVTSAKLKVRVMFLLGPKSCETMSEIVQGGPLPGGYNPYKKPYKWVTGVITPMNGVITVTYNWLGPTLYQPILSNH